MDKINHCINHNRFIPIDTEELTALELIGKGTEKTNELVDKSNDHEERITNNEKKKVSFDDMKEKFKFDNNFSDIDYRGKWFGLDEPTLSDEGMRSQVQKNRDDILKHTEQLDNMATKLISVTALGCTANESDASNNTILIQNAINNNIDLNFNILVPINDTIKILKSYSNHKLNFENKYTTGLLMLSNNKAILETVEYGTKNIVINELGLQYKTPQRVGCENSKALFFNLQTDISQGFYGWTINGIYIKNAYSGIVKSDVDKSVVWGCYFKDIQIEDVYGKPISLVGVNGGQLDNKFEGVKIYNYNIVDLGQGDIRNDGNSAIEVSGECKIDLIDIENWQLSLNKPIIKLDRVNGNINSVHLERIHFKNSECNIFDIVNSQCDINTLNMSNLYYYDTCNEVNIIKLTSDVFGNSNTKVNLKNVVIKDKKQNSTITKKYMVKQNNIIPCFANIENFVQYQTDNNWIINNPSQTNDVFKNIRFESKQVELTQLPTLGTWNKGEYFILNNRKIYVEKSGTMRTISAHACNTTTGSNIVNIVGSMQSYAFYVDEFVAINGEDFKIIARGNNQLTLDKNCASTLNNVAIVYTQPLFTQYKRVDEIIQNGIGFLKYMRDGNVVNIKGEITFTNQQTANSVKLFDLPTEIQSNESTFSSGETIAINMCSSSGGSVGNIPVLLKNNSVLAHCGIRGSLSDVKKINVNIIYFISHI